MDTMQKESEPSFAMAIWPKNENLVIESHGSNIFGRLLLPARQDAAIVTPVVLMLHGSPGNEQNLDIAQAIRTHGMAALHFSYRGVWGSHGTYSFSHILEDTLRMGDFINEGAERFGIDPKRLILFGHSVGGFAALNAIAQGIPAAGAIILAPCDLAYKCLCDESAFRPLIAAQEKGYFNVPSEEYLAADARAHGAQWLFTSIAQKLDMSIPYRFVGGALDRQTPPNVHITPILRELEKRGADVQYTEFQDGHSFPATRVALTEHIIACLQQMV